MDITFQLVRNFEIGNRKDNFIRIGSIGTIGTIGSSSISSIGSTGRGDHLQLQLVLG
ncbi:hypothetical protein D3C75_678420 [compost metagenome]